MQYQNLQAMANKTAAILLTAQNEGGYAPAFGKSGETYGGVDRLHQPGWAGWAVVDSSRKVKGAFIPAANPYLISFYDKFWKSSGAAGINNQALANFYFDFFFHKPAIAVAFMNDIAAPYVRNTNTYTLSPAVIKFINNNENAVYAALWQKRYNHYNSSEMPVSYNGKKINYKKSKTGLLRRVNKYAKSIAGISGIGTVTKKQLDELFKNNSWFEKVDTNKLKQRINFFGEIKKQFPDATLQILKGVHRYEVYCFYNKGRGVVSAEIPWTPQNEILIKQIAKEYNQAAA